MTVDDTTRRAALSLLKSGAANLSEVSRLAGVSRQAVQKWAKIAAIDWRPAFVTRGSPCCGNARSSAARS